MTTYYSKYKESRQRAYKEFLKRNPGYMSQKNKESRERKKQKYLEMEAKLKEYEKENQEK